MLWRFPAETIEDLETTTLHRVGCPELDPAHPHDRHPAGSSIRRDIAPRECWQCRPEVELVLGA